MIGRLPRQTFEGLWQVTASQLTHIRQDVCPWGRLTAAPPVVSHELVYDIRFIVCHMTYMYACMLLIHIDLFNVCQVEIKLCFCWFSQRLHSSDCGFMIIANESDQVS